MNLVKRVVGRKVGGTFLMGGGLFFLTLWRALETVGACKVFLLLEFILSESFIPSGSQIRFRDHLLFTEVKSQKRCLPWEEKKLIFLYSGIL